MNGPGELASYRFSTDALPERDRVGVWREFFGRHVAGLDLEPVGDDPLHVDIKQQFLNRISVATTFVSAYRARRTKELLGDNRHDKVLLIPGYRGVHAQQRGREAVVREGEAVLLSESDTLCLEQPGTRTSRPREQYFHVILPDEVLAALVPNPEDSVLQVIPARDEALRLLRNYLGMLGNGDGLVTMHTAHVIATHIQDLAVLAIGGSRDAQVVAKRRGLGAARLVAVQTLVRASLGDPDLMLANVAKHLDISPRYVRKLFASQGTCFSDYVLEQRLEQVWRMLSSVAFAHLRISDIAYGCGFGDLSYFNRSFRRRYGMTPSDARADALSHSD